MIAAGAVARVADRLRTGLCARRGRIRLGDLHCRQHADEHTEIAPLLIVSKLEQYDYAGASAIAVVMLVLSFAIMLGINALQSWAATRHRER